MTPRVDIFGGGAFGAALAIAYARAGLSVSLWARDVTALLAQRESPRLLGHKLTPKIEVFGDLAKFNAPIALLAIPTQSIADAIASGVGKNASAIVCCAKGIDTTTNLIPAELISRSRPNATVAQLTGPSFADDIASGLPTALTIACNDDAAGKQLQSALSTPDLRLYRTTDTVGASLGGALKNVIAIAAGAVTGAGLGESARAALIARGFAEMTRVAVARGARRETLGGLSGLGDLVLTCGSDGSRNFRFGYALAKGKTLPEGMTVEGLHTARVLKTSKGGLEAARVPWKCRDRHQQERQRHLQ